MNSVDFTSSRDFVQRVLSASLLVAGTTIGAGMLGIPLLTVKAGFLPALVMNVLVWLFMVSTGLLVLEVSLKMPPNTNIMSIAKHILGPVGQWVAGAMFLFLYSCLMVAYFSGGAPLFAKILSMLKICQCQDGYLKYFLFAGVWGGVIVAGARSIARINVFLMVALIASYLILVSGASFEINSAQLMTQNWSMILIGVPVLFSAFGYHNIIPSLCTYLNRDKKALKYAIWIGTAVPLVVYIVWQWIVLGVVSESVLIETAALGLPASEALVRATGQVWLKAVTESFAFLALITSFLGVGLSMVDFVQDGWKSVGLESWAQLPRWVICIGVLSIPLFFAMWDPTLFDKALGVAGGIGEAFLNGLLPVLLVAVGGYWVPWRKLTLTTLAALSLAVLFFELQMLGHGFP